MTLVLDASAAVELVLALERGARVATALVGENLVAPELLDVEVLSAVHRLRRTKQITGSQADRGIDRFARLPARRVSHVLLRERAWLLRDAVRIGDASYLACAAAVGAPLLTCDRRLAGAAAPGVNLLLVR